MPIPANKQELLQAIDTDFNKLYKELNTISSDDASRKELEGHAAGTTMSIHNLVAYLTGWGELVIRWIDRSSKGEHVDFPETGYKWNQLGQLAQKFYTDYEHLSYEVLLQKLQSIVAHIVTLINARTNDELYGAPWYEKYTMGRMIQLNTSSPYKNALVRVRKWKKR